MQTEVNVEAIQVTVPVEFRVRLQNELVARCRRNASYSLRAFARFLQIEPSSLSRILRGRRAITKKMFLRMANRLSLSPDEIQSYLTHEFEKKGRSWDDQDVHYEQINHDAFHVLSDWYHLALVSLLDVKDADSDPRWLANALGVTVSEVNIALERLRRLGMIKPLQDKWVVVSGHLTTTGYKHSDEALRKLQRQVLEKAIEALERYDLDRRDQSSVTMAIDPERLPEAKEKIRRFRRSLCRFLQTGANKKEVYNVSISLYPLTDLEAKAPALLQ